MCPCPNKTELETESRDYPHRSCSIIVTTHKRPELLSKALQSVRSQSWTDYECLVVSDDSTEWDTVEAIVAALDDNRFRFLASTRRGANASRNLGMSQALGKILSFLDDDDEWLPERLEVHVERHQVAAFVYSAVINRFHGRPTFDVYYDFEPGCGTYEQLLKFEFCPPTTSCVSFDREILLDNKWDESIGSFQDWDFWVRLLAHGASIGKIHRPLAVCNHHSGGRTSTNYRKRFEALLIIRYKHANILNEVDVFKQARRELLRSAKSIVVAEGFSGLLYFIKRRQRYLKCNSIIIIKLIFALIKPKNTTFWYRIVTVWCRRYLMRQNIYLKKVNRISLC